MRSDHIRTLFLGLSMVGIQIVLLRHLKIFDAESDLVLLFIIWLCTKKSKTECLIYAGLLGFLQDAIIDLWGLNMFSKTLLVFILHGFLNRISENRTIFWEVFLVILGAAFLHNCIFLGVTLFSEAFASGFAMWSLLLASSVFTAVVGSFLHLVRIDT